MSKSYWAFSTVVMVCAALAAPSRAADVSQFQAKTWTYGSSTMNYRLYVPANYDPSKQYPVTLFLHGAGEIGTNNTSQINGNIDNLFNHLKMPQYESILIAPQTNSWWSGTEIDHAVSIVKQIEQQYNTNPDKIFCTGLSMGGGGTWDAAARFNNEFDAYVPICGVAYSTSYAPIIAQKPVWAFHAADDGTVNVSASRNMINAIKAAGGNPLYTEYATGGHGIWGRAYNTAELYDWMFNAPSVRPDLVCQKQDLGNGKYGYTFSIANNDGKQLAYSVTLAFEGVDGATISQQLALGNPVNTEPNAMMYNGFDGYSMNSDSWIGTAFSQMLPGADPRDGTIFTQGPLSGSDYFVFSAGTMTGQTYGDGVKVAYIVADGDLQWSGQIGRDSQLYSVSGMTPEPATLALMLLGGVILRRRARQA